MISMITKKHPVRCVLTLLLVLAMCLQLCAAPASYAAPISGADGTVTIWRWERVDSQDDLPTTNGSFTNNGVTEKYRHPVLLLYQHDGNQYMVDGDNHTSGNTFQFIPTMLPDGVIYGEKTFRTLDKVSHMEMRYVGTDDDNGGAKKFRFRLDSAQDDSGVIANLDLESDYYFKNSKNVSEYTNITVLTADCSDGHDLSASRVKMFANISSAKDALIRINSSNGKVYTERSVTWKMGEFVMYVGYMEQLSAVRSDITIKSGQVANYNGYVYVEPNVTITVEEGGVLSVSGALYNNGTIINKGGDIVVQKKAAIEQYCLDDDPGGVICCDGGDLVILSGGRVTTGVTESYSDYKTGLGNGFILRNGATCTNFGTLAVGSNAYVCDGATLDNRSGGKMLFGYQAKSIYSGNLYGLDAEKAASLDTYEISSVHDEKKGTVERADLLYVGSDVLLNNDGDVYLGCWAVQTYQSSNVTAQGSGAIHTLDWAEKAAESYSWIPFPTGWNAMTK